MTYHDIGKAQFPAKVPSAAKAQYHPPKLRQLSRAQIAPQDRLVFASVKHLCVSDGHDPKIDSFVKQIFAKQTLIERFEVSGDVIPGSIGKASILVISGAACDLLAGLLRENAPLIRRVPKFVFSENSSVEFKRLLLECGADMVFDTQEIKLEECRARMVAIWERYLMTKEADDSQFLVEQAVLRVFRKSLSQREAAIARVFLTKKDETVSRGDLARLANLSEEIKSDNALSVLVNRIRSKMADGFEIASVRGVGYKLVERDL